MANTVKCESLDNENHTEKPRLMSFSFINHFLFSFRLQDGSLFTDSLVGELASVLTSAPSDTSGMKESSLRARPHHPGT